MATLSVCHSQFVSGIGLRRHEHFARCPDGSSTSGPGRRYHGSGAGSRFDGAGVSSARLQLLVVDARRAMAVKCAAAAAEDSAKDQDWDVSSNCVTPVFRVSPVTEEEAVRRKGDTIQIIFVSEGNVCRSIYGEAIFSALLREHGIQDVIRCSSKATRDYNAGEPADPRAVEVAEKRGLKLLEGKVATVFDCASDIVVADLLLVMDKFTAADVLKEATLIELASKQGSYSSKIEDIEDPLYFNMGGPEEQEAIEEVYENIRHSCEGLIDYILEVRDNLEGSQSLQEGVALALSRMNALNWLAPPMLTKL